MSGTGTPQAAPATRFSCFPLHRPSLILFNAPAWGDLYACNGVHRSERLACNGTSGLRDFGPPVVGNRRAFGPMCPPAAADKVAASRGARPSRPARNQGKPHGPLAPETTRNG